MKPIKRSKARVLLGKIYFTCKTYFKWYFGKIKYTKKLSPKLLYNIYFKHKTPLIRKLKDVDMWMQHNKVKNLQLAIKKIDGVMLHPGETFSYWRLIGKPTKKKGYVEGMQLFCGTVQAGVGGGLCQLSNLIYWMTLHTPLTVTERYRHSYDVFPDSNRSQPFGSGATCVYNYRDLCIYNGTNQTYQLHVFMTDNDLVGEWRTENSPEYRFEVYEKNHWITHEYWGGYVRHNTIYRRIFDRNGVLVNDEYVAENHAIMMYQPFLEEANSTINI